MVAWKNFNFYNGMIVLIVGILSTMAIHEPIPTGRRKKSGSSRKSALLAEYYDSGYHQMGASEPGRGNSRGGQWGAGMGGEAISSGGVEDNHHLLNSQVIVTVDETIAETEADRTGKKITEIRLKLKVETDL